MITLNPYLIFKDNCEEAFNYYKTVFNGEILFMGYYKDVPEDSRQYFPGSTDEQIMHAAVKISENIVIMGNDTVATYEKVNGTIINNFFLFITLDDKQNAYRIFDELGAGGKIVMPVAPTFWATHYGIVIDKFGISWKITFDPNHK